MSLETDLLLDRRRLKRRLFFWRTFAVLAVLFAVLVALRGASLPFGSAHLARLTVTGVITDDRKLTETVAKLADNDNVKALIVAIDSPGGSVAGGESLHDAARRFARGLRSLAARPERVVLAVCHELPIRFALNAASGSANLDQPEHQIANATPYLFEQATLELAAERIERLLGPGACPS